MFGIKTEEFKKSCYVEPGTQLQINNGRGNISIKGWEEDTIELIAVKQGALGLFMNQVMIEVNNEDRFVINTKYCTSLSQGVSVDYIIRVPEGILVSQVETLAGNINIEHVAGGGIVQTVNGRIDISNISGDVTAKTTRGAVEINGVSGSVSAITVNGKVTVAEADCIKEIRTSRGTIFAEVSAIQEDLDISSKSGGITVFINPGINADITVGTSSGSISHEELPLSVIESTNNRLIATMGEGGKAINITTSSGPISLKLLP
jgi:uncharacterized protein YneR